MTSDANQAFFNRVRGTGARFVRLSYPWREVVPPQRPSAWQPANPADPNYTWGALDRFVRRAIRAGLTPLVQVIDPPDWTQRCTARYGLCDPRPRDVADFATAVARHYNGGGGPPRVRYWQLFNEPNLAYYFQPQFRNGKPVSPSVFRTLLNAFARSIKSVHSSNLVVGPGLGPLKFRGGLGPLDFMRRLLCMQGRRKPRPARGCRERSTFDVWATNPYTTGGPTHEAAGKDDVSLGDLPEMRRLLRAAERAGHIKTRLRPVPFWITEFSWDSKPPDPGGLSWRIHARWAAEAMYRAWRAGVSAFFWLNLRDDPPGGQPHYQVIDSGLYLRGPSLAGDKPKRVLPAFRFPFVAFRGKSGIRVWGRTPTSSGGRVRIEVGKGRRWRKIATLRADRNGIFQRVIRTRFGRNKRGLVRARYRDQRAVPFSLRYVGDFYAPAFGLGPGEHHVPQRLARLSGADYCGLSRVTSAMLRASSSGPLGSWCSAPSPPPAGRGR